MALVKFHNGQALFMSPEKAGNMWLCINGYLPFMNDQQKRFAARVKKIYLNPGNAPKEYLDARKDEDREKQLELMPRPWYADR